MERNSLAFYKRSTSRDSVTLLSVPLEIGSDERGLAEAPTYLFDQGLEKVLASLGREISETKTISVPQVQQVASAGRMKYGEEIAAVAKRVAMATEKAMKRGDTVITLGGDHSISMGTIAGAAAAYQSLGVIYIDAHPDCNTDETTISGNVHGMVTAAAMGVGHEVLTKIAKRHVDPENFVFLGLKDIDEAEIEFLQKRSIPCTTILDIARHGLAPALAAIDRLAHKVDAVWVSLDMDAIDAAYAPGVGLDSPDGLTRREIVGIAQYLGKTCRVAGLDIVEMVPKKDTDAKTAGLALELLARFLGGEYNWYKGYMDTYRETNVTESSKRILTTREQGQAV
ncbi:hypothetical protein COU17_01980 [Candidatus Kaiserbacteria bacterium CG10_big_fil_rev_8_21_14_0_10_49_17]|uniref:Arginase n=1 Tax=Candidatus Kaiserbacteria bacterium CG10_big_fil_rev_8_21_14_0_10_49_17 TaxID=1974609 RepID=A0A2M6WED4_9BACT|nr:MAG: hypothetical protein COU17_01980 [Candidatus Kaiserbacteria bacterium CG10_big_fil_rev_8_21_14_0_10_49_17]